jgi:hypothetical protein
MRKKKLSRKELENKIFTYLWLKDPVMAIEFFDISEKQAYDRVRYLGLAWIKSEKT